MEWPISKILVDDSDRPNIAQMKMNRYLGDDKKGKYCRKGKNIRCRGVQRSVTKLQEIANLNKDRF